MQCYFGEAVCTGLFRTDFFCTDFCTDFLHGFFARISCTDFLHGFFARILCTDFLHDYFCGFLRGLCARIVCTDVCTDFCTDFLGCPKTLAGKRQNFTEKIPRKKSPRKSPEIFTMVCGPSGEGLGRQEGEVRLWPA